MERRKYLGRAYKDYYKTFTSKIIRVDEEDIKGYVARVEIEEVNRPFMVGEKGFEVCLADNGYSEINYLPDNKNWGTCAIYDEQGDIIEWYFDITRKNAVDEQGNPYCDDMYLDAALMPDGRILIFDEDELCSARDNGDITEDEFHMAYRVLGELIEEEIMSVSYMNALCSRLLALIQ